MDAIVRATNAFAVNLRPATPITVRNAGPLPLGEWAAVDKLVAADVAKLAATAAGAGKTVGAAAEKVKQKPANKTVAATASA